MPVPAVERPTEWPHAPLHMLGESGTYCVTAATLNHAHHFEGDERKGVLHRGLLALAKKYGWQIEAWAVFSNHYHFVGHSPADAGTLKTMCKELHAETARWLNKRDGTPGRRVWFEFWDTQLTTMPSYFARLAYVHDNAARHGLVKEAEQYPYCSAGWFQRVSDPVRAKKVLRMKTDRVNVPDGFGDVR